MRSIVAVLALAAWAGVVAAPEVRAQAVEVVFLEPVEAEPEGELPAFREVEDPDRLGDLRALLDAEASRMALELWADAVETLRGRGAPAPAAYPIALVPGGNFADSGFRLVGPDGSVEERPDAPYVRLGPDPWRFESTILHETGHVVLRLLNGKRPIPVRPLAPISHTTAALTDRGTAFDEGFAIHLETVLAHFGTSPAVRSKYHRDQLLFGTFPGWLSEYYRAAADLGSYSQTAARWRDVRENAFAFAPAHRGAGYLRSQLDPARDFATLRGPNQLLQAEGFYAAFFYGVAVRGARRPDRETARARQREVLEVLAHAFETVEAGPETPWLIEVLDAWRAVRPETYPEALDAFLDLGHGVFVDPGAGARWRDHYLATLRLDVEGRDREGIEAARERWRETVRADPSILRSRLGPALPCAVDAVTVELVALGAAPLIFDANTAEEGVLRSVPGIDEATARGWMEERERRPFRDAADLRRRVDPWSRVADALACGSERD